MSRYRQPIASKKKTDTSPISEDNGRSEIQTLQENTTFVDNPTGPTTITVNEFCSPIVSLGGNSDTRHDCSQNREFEDASDGSHVADDIPADIAIGPEQAPVQPRIKFTTTLKGNKHHSFNSEWYKQYCWLEYSRERDAAYCYPCRLFFTKNDFML